VPREPDDDTGAYPFADAVAVAGRDPMPTGRPGLEMGNRVRTHRPDVRVGTPRQLSRR